MSWPLQFIIKSTGVYFILKRQTGTCSSSDWDANYHFIEHLLSLQLRLFYFFKHKKHINKGEIFYIFIPI